jgi:hypothetical protein
VNAENIAGKVWSEPLQFTTVYPLPSPPVPVFPSTGFTAETDTLQFIWSMSSPHVTRYSIEIARDSLMAVSFADSTAVDTQMTKYMLDDGADFWWRVKAYNKSGWSAYSEIRRFSVRFPVIPIFRFSLDRFILSGTKGLIVYHVAKKCDVSLEFLDLRGNCIWKRRRRGRPPGRHVEKLPLNKFHAGYYFLRFNAGPFEKRAGAILVK